MGQDGAEVNGRTAALVDIRKLETPGRATYVPEDPLGGSGSWGERAGFGLSEQDISGREPKPGFLLSSRSQVRVLPGTPAKNTAGLGGVRRRRAGHRQHRSRPPQRDQPADRRAGRRDQAVPAGGLPAAGDLAEAEAAGLQPGDAASVLVGHLRSQLMSCRTDRAIPTTAGAPAQAINVIAPAPGERR